VVGEHDVPGLIAAINEAKDLESRRQRGQMALQFARDQFQMGRTCERMAMMLECAFADQRSKADVPRSAISIP